MYKNNQLLDILEEKPIEIVAVNITSNSVDLYWKSSDVSLESIEYQVYTDTTLYKTVTCDDALYLDNYTDRYVYHANINDLDSDKTYSFRIRTSNNIWDNYSFTTGSSVDSVSFPNIEKGTEKVEHFIIAYSDSHSYLFNTGIHGTYAFDSLNEDYSFVDYADYTDNKLLSLSGDIVSTNNDYFAQVLGVSDTNLDHVINTNTYFTNIFTMLSSLLPFPYSIAYSTYLLSDNTLTDSAFTSTTTESLKDYSGVIDSYLEEEADSLTDSEIEEIVDNLDSIKDSSEDNSYNLYLEEATKVLSYLFDDLFYINKNNILSCVDTTNISCNNSTYIINSFVKSNRNTTVFGSYLIEMMIKNGILSADSDNSAYDIYSLSVNGVSEVYSYAELCVGSYIQTKEGTNYEVVWEGSPVSQHSEAKTFACEGSGGCPNLFNSKKEECKTRKVNECIAACPPPTTDENGESHDDDGCENSCQEQREEQFEVECFTEVKGTLSGDSSLMTQCLDETGKDYDTGAGANPNYLLPRTGSTGGIVFEGSASCDGEYQSVKPEHFYSNNAEESMKSLATNEFMSADFPVSINTDEIINTNEWCKKVRDLSGDNADDIIDDVYSGGSTICSYDGTQTIIEMDKEDEACTDSDGCICYYSNTYLCAKNGQTCRADGKIITTIQNNVDNKSNNIKTELQVTEENPSLDCVDPDGCTCTYTDGTTLMAIDGQSCILDKKTLATDNVCCYYNSKLDYLNESYCNNQTGSSIIESANEASCNLYGIQITFNKGGNFFEAFEIVDQDKVPIHTAKDLITFTDGVVMAVASFSSGSWLDIVSYDKDLCSSAPDSICGDDFELKEGEIYYLLSTATYILSAYTYAYTDVNVNLNNITGWNLVPSGLFIYNADNTEDIMKNTDYNITEIAVWDKATSQFIYTVIDLYDNIYGNGNIDITKQQGIFIKIERK